MNLRHVSRSALRALLVLFAVVPLGVAAPNTSAGAAAPASATPSPRVTLDDDPSPWELRARPLLDGPSGCVEVRGTAKIEIVYVKPGGWRSPGESTRSVLEGPFEGRLEQGVWVSRSMKLATVSGPPVELDDVMPVVGRQPPRADGETEGGSVSISVSSGEATQIAADGARGANLVDKILDALDPTLSFAWVAPGPDGSVRLTQQVPTPHGKDPVELITRFPGGGAPDRLDVRLPRRLRVSEGLMSAELLDGQAHVRAVDTSAGVMPVEEGLSVVLGALGFTVGMDRRLNYTAWRACPG